MVPRNNNIWSYLLCPPIILVVAQAINLRISSTDIYTPIYYGRLICSTPCTRVHTAFIVPVWLVSKK